MFYSRPYLSTTYQNSSIIGHFPAFPIGVKESDGIICSYTDNSEGGSLYYRKMRPERYASFKRGEVSEFENGRRIFGFSGNPAVKNREPGVISDKQQLYEELLSMYI